MPAAKTHPFLEGTFAWSERGYNLAGPPPLDLRSAAALNSTDPWVAIAAALEHAKAGDHRPIRGLSRWFLADPPFFADRVAILATGDAGTAADLAPLEGLLRDGPDAVRAYAAEAAVLAGALWLVPAMLAAWLAVKQLGDRETIGFALCDLLEGPDDATLVGLAGAAPRNLGLMAQLGFPAHVIAAADTEPDDDDPGFETLAATKFWEVVDRLGDDRVATFQGAPFGVKRLAEGMLAAAQGAAPEETSWVLLRHKFEAPTGVDCTRFFRAGAFQPLAATAILEEFLDGPEADRYEDGRRYFYGHLIPS